MSRGPAASPAPPARNGVERGRLVGLARRFATHPLTREEVLWSLALSVLLLDLATTWYGLRLGLRETNWIALQAIAEFGFIGLGALKGTALAVAVGGWRYLPASARFVAPTCLILPWGFAAGYNAVLIVSVLVA